MRVLWWFGGVVLGLLVSGGIAGIVVPLATQSGVALGPWFVWVLLGVCVAAGIWGMEHVRTRRTPR